MKQTEGCTINNWNHPPRELLEFLLPVYSLVDNTPEENAVVETNSKTMPWNQVETFGKQRFNKSPGQAHLCQWPLKLKLISSVSPYFHKAHLILSADCAAYSYKSFHSNLLRNRILVIGCPELDSADYVEKLTEIFRSNDILSIAVVRMDAPCLSLHLLGHQRYDDIKRLIRRLYGIFRLFAVISGLHKDQIKTKTKSKAPALNVSHHKIR